jgi:cardiolipin synthase
MSWTIVTALEVVWIPWVVLWLVLERRSPAATIAWILGLALLPVVGIPVYLLLGPRRLRRKRLRHARARQAVTGGVAPAPVDASVHEESAGPLMRLIANCGESAPARAERVRVFDNGRDTYAAIEAALARAEHHVHVEYYIFEPDRTGTRIRDALVACAKRGVEVRLLVDAMGSRRLDRRFLAPLLEAGGEFAWFNPLVGRRLRPVRVNFRTHRKIVVCDGRVGFTGGVNVSDVHTANASGDAAWRDTHVCIEGAAVRALGLVFLEDWHFATGSAPLGPPYFPLPSGDGEHVVQFLGSGPDDGPHSIHKLFFSAIATAHTRVLVTTPYFVPDTPILTALITAAMRGVEVRVLVPTPRLNDLWVVAAAGRSYYEELLAAGVRIFEYQPTMLHAKCLVADDTVAVVGTANLDNRSFRLNFEVAAACYGEDSTAKLAALFERDLARAEEVTLESVRDVTFGRRALEATARLLSPLL